MSKTTIISEKPLLSVGLPVYNGESYLEKSISSILQQSFEDFELIISDNASTDNTPEICITYQKLDKRIKYHHSHENKGAAWNFRRVFQLSQGRFFVWATDDDYFDKNYFYRCIEILQKDDTIILCYANTNIIDAGGKIQKIHKDRFQLLCDSPSERFKILINKLQLCNSAFGLIRSSVLAQTPVHDNFVASDQPLLAELAIRGKFYEIEEPLIFRRIHPSASRPAHPTDDLLAVWYNPRTKGKPPCRHWHHLVAYLSAIKRSKIKKTEKLRCYFYLMKFYRYKWRNLCREMLDVFGYIKLKLRST